MQWNFSSSCSGNWYISILRPLTNASQLNLYQNSCVLTSPPDEIFSSMCAIGTSLIDYVTWPFTNQHPKNWISTKFICFWRHHPMNFFSQSLHSRILVTYRSLLSSLFRASMAQCNNPPLPPLQRHLYRICEMAVRPARPLWRTMSVDRWWTQCHKNGEKNRTIVITRDTAPTLVLVKNIGSRVTILATHSQYSIPFTAAFSLTLSLASFILPPSSPILLLPPPPLWFCCASTQSQANLRRRPAHSNSFLRGFTRRIWRTRADFLFFVTMAASCLGTRCSLMHDADYSCLFVPTLLDAPCSRIVGISCSHILETHRLLLSCSPHSLRTLRHAFQGP